MPGETPSTPGGTPTTPPTDPTQQPGTPAPSETPVKWEDWIAQQPEQIKSLIDTHTTGLKSALQSERGTRGNLEKQLKDLQAKAEKGSDLERQLGEINGQLAQENTRGEFYEAAHAAGATNLRAAYLLAKADGLIDERGKFKIEDIKGRYPEFFTPPKTPTPTGNAGSGAGAQPPQLSGNAAVNNAIRGAAGIRL